LWAVLVEEDAGGFCREETMGGWLQPRLSLSFTAVGLVKASISASKFEIEVGGRAVVLATEELVKSEDNLESSAVDKDAESATAFSSQPAGTLFALPPLRLCRKPTDPVCGANFPYLLLLLESKPTTRAEDKMLGTVGGRGGANLSDAWTWRLTGSWRVDDDSNNAVSSDRRGATVFFDEFTEGAEMTSWLKRENDAQGFGTRESGGGEGLLEPEDTDKEDEADDNGNATDELVFEGEGGTMVAFQNDRPLRDTGDSQGVVPLDEDGVDEDGVMRGDVPKCNW
jgi:hypothetical protein